MRVCMFALGLHPIARHGSSPVQVGLHIIQCSDMSHTVSCSKYTTSSRCKAIVRAMHAFDSGYCLPPDALPCANNALTFTACAMCHFALVLQDLNTKPLTPPNAMQSVAATQARKLGPHLLQAGATWQQQRQLDDDAVSMGTTVITNLDGEPCVHGTCCVHGSMAPAV